jgi:uncharacterized protein (DUF1501 family)
MFSSRQAWLSRRETLQLTAAGVLGTSVSGWFHVLADQASDATSQGVKHKSCILLWMAGGPAQSHTFDVKPGGEFKPIASDVPGIQISEHLPSLARQVSNLALLRGMRTGDANHNTGAYLMHTGFRKGTGGTVHPSLGAMVAHDLGPADSELPNFVAVGGTQGPGYLGPKYAPLIVNDFARGLPDLQAFTSQEDVDARASLVDELDRAFLEDYQASSTRAHQTSIQRAVELMHSGKTKAFQLTNEPASSREAYGQSRFGQGCLLARRLVEAGVSFVEVSLGGWDTHNNTAPRIRTLSQQLDQGMATLVGDLKQRGLLDTTLVIWMGEFGRTPGSGQNHYARAWTTVLAGAGLKVGQAIGRTGAKGTDVDGRAITAPDFMATVCKALEMDPTKNYTARGGRPMAKVAKEAKSVVELFG